MAGYTTQFPFFTMTFTPYKYQITSGGREIQSKSQILSVYMERITGDSRLEQINIVVTGEESSFESIPQSSNSGKEASRVKVTYQQRKTK